MASNPLAIDGLDDLLNKLKNLPAHISDEVGMEIEASGNTIAAGAKRDAPTDNGFLKNGISVVKIDPLTVEVVSQVDYSAFVEFGTRTQVNIPAGLEIFADQFRNSSKVSALGAKEAIFDWCKRKGIEPKAWYPIYISLMVKGSEPHPFFFNNFLIEKPKLIERIKKIVDP